MTTPGRRTLKVTAIVVASLLGVVVVVFVALLVNFYYETRHGQPPQVSRLEVVEDEVYAFVGDERLYIYRSRDQGETWREVEGIEELPDGFPVVGHQTLSGPWFDHGVLTNQPVRCAAEDTTVCYLRQVSLSQFQASKNGGVTWTAFLDQAVPELFQEGVPYVHFDWIWCEGEPASCQRGGGDPRLGVDIEGYFTLHQGAVQMSFDGGETWESGWLPQLEPGRVPERVEDLEPTRCDPNDLAMCYRPSVVEQRWLRSADGGLTWSAIGGDGAPRASEAPRLEGLVCVVDNRCFRGLNGGLRPTTTVVNAPDPAEGWQPRAIEETNDGGLSWHQAWAVSPRFGGSRSATFIAIPNDLAAVGETLLVSLGEDGILRRTPAGTWETVGVGPVRPLRVALMPSDGPRVALAWSLSLTLVVFGAYLAKHSRLVGFTVIAAGALMTVIYLMQTSEYPYGIADTLIGEVFFNGAPILTLMLGVFWLFRRTGPAEANRVLVRSLMIGALPLLLAFPSLI